MAPAVTVRPRGIHEPKKWRRSGGESGIRTHDTVTRIHAFQACAFDHSAISPRSQSKPWVRVAGFTCRTGERKQWAGAIQGSAALPQHEITSARSGGGMGSPGVGAYATVDPGRRPAATSSLLQRNML